LRRPAQVQRRRDAEQRALADRTEKVCFQFDGGEAATTFWQVDHRAVAAGRVSERNHRATVQHADGIEQLWRDLHRQADALARELNHDDAKVTRHAIGADRGELLDRPRKGLRHRAPVLRKSRTRQTTSSV
jgi:hypothetical protein